MLAVSIEAKPEEGAESMLCGSDFLGRGTGFFNWKKA
jgi:hypothetical protein